MSTALEHENAILAAFAEVLRAEQSISSIKASLDRTTHELKAEIAARETELASAWAAIAVLMAETGEVETTLPGATNDYRIAWAVGRESVRAEADATPDEFVKIERLPKLKEIGDHLRQLRKEGRPLPNWASFETGKKKLRWTAVKKGARRDQGSV